MKYFKPNNVLPPLELHDALSSSTQAVKSVAAILSDAGTT